METYKTYEKYGKKALEPLEASYPLTQALFVAFGRSTLIVLSAIASASS